MKAKTKQKKTHSFFYEAEIVTLEHFGFPTRIFSSYLLLES
jgi:hypothetical protein